MQKLIILAVATALCSLIASRAMALQEGVRPAKLITIEASTSVRSISLPAVVEAVNSADLAFQVGGVLTDISVIEGDSVTKGAVIARLDARDFRLELDRARSQFDSAETEFQRAQRLLEEDTVSQAFFEQRQVQRDVAAAALALAEKRLADAVLRAPFDGTVAVIHVDQFQSIQPKQTIVTLQSSGTLTAVAQAPASLVSSFGRLEPVEIYVVLDVAPNRRLATTLYSVSTQANPTTQTFEVKFAFSPPEDLNILPGMTGTFEGRVLVRDDEGSVRSIRIPLSAVVSDGSQTYVWVVDPETMAVVRRDVVIGAGVGETLVVESGLEPGDRIVAAGAAFLREGTVVRPYTP